MKIYAQFWMRLLPPVIAVTLALFFVLTIHPISGFIGGFLFLLTGWAIPSVINLLLSFWIAWSFRFHAVIRIVIFVSASFLLGINSWLPEFFSPPPVPPVEASISRPVPITRSTPVDGGLRAAIPDSPRIDLGVPDPLGVNVLAEEGCGCMYFVYGHMDNSYYSEFSRRMDNAGLSFTRRKVFYSFDPVKYPNGVHFDIKFTPSGDSHHVSATINVYDGMMKTATYAQRDLPIAVFDSKGVGWRRPLLSANFYDYCISMLMHRNFWTVMFAKRISGDPTAPFSDFLSKALPKAD
ncbi:MAG: hypothetical protein JSR56_07305 [Proteobacteria bacterium]|nr:hypothetical protein [Pseudomonadota bacterium]